MVQDLRAVARRQQPSAFDRAARACVALVQAFAPAGGAAKARPSSVPRQPQLDLTSALGGALLLLSSTATARTFEVVATDMTFTPTTITIYQYDRIRFRNGGGLHNVVADDNSFRCAVNCNTNTAPSALLWSAGVQFTRLGTFGYFCEQHGDVNSGMRGVIVVIDRVFVDGFAVVEQP
jgi:plastocyanin